jgi:hypothetical protein
VVSLGDAAWGLPLDAAFLGLESRPAGYRYSVPVPPGPLAGFSLALLSGDGEHDAGVVSADFFLELVAIRLRSRWFGCALAQDRVLEATPFVYRDGPALVADVPEAYRLATFPEIRLEGLSAPAIVGAGGLLFEYRPPSFPAQLTIVPENLPAGAAPYPVRFEAGDSSGFPAGGIPAAFRLTASPKRAFPLEPVPSDPGLILDYPREAWRDSRYEIFRWTAFPDILIMDTADYGVQDNILRRLAFFVEKTGYRGRLSTDRELAGLHGWNAHDYKADDLARFFDLAREQNFPLLPEERELEGLLLANGIIREEGEGKIVPGLGALVSMSRESPDYLRSRLLIHEGFHGIFFLDEDFRLFAEARWNNLGREPKRFIRSFFDSQDYDLDDEYLMVNEFMAYCLQQTISQAGTYFGETLAGRIYDTPWRRSALPAGDEEARVWPSLSAAFTAEARAFSGYVNSRWGLAAGRIRSVFVSGD